MRIYNRQFYVIFRCEKGRVKIVISESISVCSFINLYVTLYENKIKCCCFCLENRVQLNLCADAVNFFDLNMTRNKFFPMKSILRKKNWKIFDASPNSQYHTREKREQRSCVGVWQQANFFEGWHDLRRQTRYGDIIMSKIHTCSATILILKPNAKWCSFMRKSGEKQQQQIRTLAEYEKKRRAGYQSERYADT